jgi:hypothetical protein
VRNLFTPCEQSTPPGLLEVGDWLYASCSACIYGEVVGLATDANGAACVHLRIFESDDILSWPDAEDDEGRLGVMGKNDRWPAFAGLADIELPAGVHIVLRGLHYKAAPTFDAKPGEYRYGKRADSADATFGEDGSHLTTGKHVEVLTPGSGCYRCTKYFSVARPASTPDPATPRPIMGGSGRGEG